MKIKKFSSYPGITIALVFALINALLVMFSVWHGDGIKYAFFHAPNFEDISYHRVISLKEIWDSQINHYIFTNGRLACHYLVQVFCALTPKWVFALCNAAVSFALLIEIFQICNKAAHSWSRSIIIGGLVWLVTFYLYYDPPFLMNYIWCAAINISILFIFFSKQKLGIVALIGTALAAFIAGEWNEAFSIPLSIALLYFACKRKFRVNRVQWVIGLAYAIGTIVLCLAPGNFTRLEKTVALDGPFSIIGFIIHSWPNFLLPTALLIMYVRNNLRRNSRRTFDSVDRFILVVIIAGFILPVAFKFSSGARMAICYNLGIIMLIGRHYLTDEFKCKISAIAVGAISIVVGFFQYHQISQLNIKYTMLVQRYHESADGYVFLPNELFGKNRLYTLGSKVRWEQEAREIDPDKPDLVILPESARNLKTDVDTNYCVQYGPQSWILVRSRKHPADFVTHKVVLPGILNLTVKPRVLDFTKEGQVAFDSTESVIVGVYINDFPFMHSEVEMRR